MTSRDHCDLVTTSAGFVFTLMAFGLFEDHHPHVPHNLIVEADPRLDVWMLLQYRFKVTASLTKYLRPQKK